eukprot:scaffold57454_cov32-Phaeocystis_antarctica.AAC.4
MVCERTSHAILRLVPRGLFAGSANSGVWRIRVCGEFGCGSGGASDEASLCRSPRTTPWYAPAWEVAGAARRKRAGRPDCRGAAA